MQAKLLSTAKIGKTHGLDGALRVYSLSGEYSHLKKLDKCVVCLSDGSEVTLDVDSVRVQGGLFLMSFVGYDTPEKARKLTKGIIKIERTKAPKLKRGEFYVADLYGMDVLVGNEVVGNVISTFDGPQAILLEVRSIQDQKNYLIPLLPVYISDVDIEKNTLKLLMPELMQ